MSSSDYDIEIGLLLGFVPINLAKTSCYISEDHWLGYMRKAQATERAGIALTVGLFDRLHLRISVHLDRPSSLHRNVSCEN